MERVALEISWASLWRVFFFVIFAMIMFMSRQILLGIFLAIVISSGLDSVVNFLEKRRIPRMLGVLLVFLLSIAIIIIIVYALIPRLLIDLKTISLNLSGPGGQWLKPLVNIQSARSFEDGVNRLLNQFYQNDISPFDFFSSVLGGVGLAISVFLSAFYLSLTRDGIERFIRAVFPESSEEAALRIFARSRRKIAIWVRTQILLSFIMTVLVWIALSILGVNNAFLLGILAGIFELVPFIGPILAGSAAVLSALLTSPNVSLALATLLVFLALHQFESHILVPLLTGRSVGLHPVIVIVALLIGVEIGGFLGILIAVPAAAVIQEIIEDWSNTRRRPRNAD